MLPKQNNFLAPEAQDTIEKAIQDAELLTSGEIRIHVDEKCGAPALERAAALFHSLGMDATAERNGVLIYLNLQGHQFAIIGDAGIHAIVKQDFWDSTKELMQNHFRHGHFLDGLLAGVQEAGKQLQQHFPRRHDDKNELADHLSYSPDGL